MICPKCTNEMIRVIKHGVTIDTCTECGGVWLDKGELGELVAGINQTGSSLDQELSRVRPSQPNYGRAHHDERELYRDDHHDDHDRHDYDRGIHKKKSIWDIFD